MRCAKCHSKEATMNFTPVVGGNAQKTVQLCQDCALPLYTSIEAVYRRVTPGEFARFQSDAKSAESFFNPSPEDLLQQTLHAFEEADNPDKLHAKAQEQEDFRILIVGTDWHALHFLLTGEGELKPHPLPPPPLGNVVQGGTETPWPCTYGRIRSLTPDEVRAAADALAGISVQELRSSFSVASFKAAKIYPYGKGWTEKAAETVFEIYPQVVQFFQAAARDGDMILLSSD